jgi:hypothetical protein
MRFTPYEIIITFKKNGPKAALMISGVAYSEPNKKRYLGHIASIKGGINSKLHANVCEGYGKPNIIQLPNRILNWNGVKFTPFLEFIIAWSLSGSIGLK